MTKGVIGRSSIFHGKVNDTAHRVQAFLTETGRKGFEEVRAHLADRAERTTASDADTIEYLVRVFMNPKVRRIWKDIDFYW